MSDELVLTVRAAAARVYSRVVTPTLTVLSHEHVACSLNARQASIVLVDATSEAH